MQSDRQIDNLKLTTGGRNTLSVDLSFEHDGGIFWQLNEGVDKIRRRASTAVSNFFVNQCDKAHHSQYQV